MPPDYTFCEYSLRLGIPEYETKRYEGRVKDGGVLLSGHCNTSDESSVRKNS